ncbi:PadR family transcriptional regulator [Candidatus Parvarchaeota archaeon]|nr:PadR family transcriptional regulator [Candidatus Parvarchaeota archaeon]
MAARKISKAPGTSASPHASRALSRVETLLRSGNLWLYIVSLASKGNIHAYTLPDQIERRFGFRPGRIMCYIVAYRLKAEGLLEVAGAGRRVYYKATVFGKRQLRAAKGIISKTASAL